VREGLLSIIGQTQATDGGEPTWLVYLDKAAEDKEWQLDDLVVPLLAFIRTDDGVDFMCRLLERRALLLGNAPAGGPFLGTRLTAAVEGRSLSPESVDLLVDTLDSLLSREELSLQPLVEQASTFLVSPAGESWFFHLGNYLLARGGGDFGGRFVALLSKAAHHPHLDVSPLVRGFFQLAVRPEGKAWQELMLRWFRTPGEGKGDGVLKAVQPLLADGRLRISEIALPTVGFLFTKEGQPLRDEVLGSLRGTLSQIDVGATARNLWRAAGNAFNTWRGGAKPVEEKKPDTKLPPPS
jgi:hypothetical protein